MVLGAILPSLQIYGEQCITNKTIFEVFFGLFSKVERKIRVGQLRGPEIQTLNLGRKLSEIP